jgi:transposase InsO family protein
VEEDLPHSPWENGYVESFNGKLRDECLNGEVFETLLEAQVLIERWWHEYNTFRPHSVRSQIFSDSWTVFIRKGSQ